MILLKVDPGSVEPLYKQIYSRIIDLIEKNVLKPGDKLPSSRKLANQLGVNRTTVYKAYEELWSKGFTECRQGSYSYIRKRVEVKTHSAVNKKIIDWSRKITTDSKDLTTNVLLHKNHAKEKGTIDFVSLSPDPRLIPAEKFRKCLNHVLIEEKESLLSYGDELGYKPLRNFIVEQMRQHSVHITEDEIILTNGCQNGIELLLKLLVKPGDKIITELPTYSSAIPLFKNYSGKIIGIPVTANGMDLRALENAIKKEKPALIYTVPNFQNPTGCTTPQVYREELLKLCQSYKLPIIEDGFSEEMKYYGKNILPIKSMDKQNLVFYLGTFSKVLFPGLRIGWIAGDKSCIQHLGSMKRASEISGIPLTQAALSRFCSLGYYELHIKKLHKVYKRRMHTAINAIKEFIPSEKFSHTKPFGGYTIWFEAKNKKIKEEELMSNIFKAGVSVSPGRIFYPEKHNAAAFRISIAKVDENEIVEGMKRIGNVLKKI